MKRVLLLALMLLSIGSCSTPRASIEPLVDLRVTQDFATYRIQRVGLLPFAGTVADPELRQSLATAFATELASRSRFEIVPLNEADLEEVPASETFRRGWTKPQTVLALARRYNLDALFVGTVSDVQSFPPQKLSVELDLVAVETGLAIWSAEACLDASQERVRAALEAWHGRERASSPESESWELTLLSPRRFAQFAAAVIASAL